METIQNQLQKAIESEKSFVFVREPNATHFQLYVDELDESNEEFVFHRFDNTETIRIHPIKKQMLSIEDIKKIQLDLVWKKAPIEKPIAQESYLNLIDKTTNILQKNLLQKVVISRTIEKEFSQFYPLDTLLALHYAYPNAAVYFIYADDKTTWFGATPELLLSREKNVVKTVSLAGTKAKENEWTSKEIDEQQVVTDYIVEQLSSFGQVATDGPYTVDAGFFHHLKTYISLETMLPFTEKMLAALHPTPAVCGMPKEKAKKYILENEGYDRQFYAGYFGWKTIEEERYYVNLRCAEVINNRVRLYVGGGIMHDSNPEKEWIETEMKAKTLLSYLKIEE
ncbi:chorismate-binding protein [uncultured Weeksella sp.]|uniref:chorismate-binding protein n=1 Tax=uncultured Weeksella sp. TaxID=1161389 RepID=UPI00259AFBD3|nr:chorismate-binding protein [uncultured Weeksella sp.]